MKSTGTVRKLDAMGRVVLPIELRQTLNLKTNDSLEIFIDGNKLVFRKYEPGCLLCGEIQSLRSVHGKNMCQKCLDTIKTST
jgi:transcriptional pleiotropic regulator of transition state genes